MAREQPSDNTNGKRSSTSLAPDTFSISLTLGFKNYRQGNIQSRQHHAGKNVNANLSLKKPPRTGVEQLGVNLHWSSTNVNIIAVEIQVTLLNASQIPLLSV